MSYHHLISENKRKHRTKKKKNKKDTGFKSYMYDSYVLSLSEINYLKRDPLDSLETYGKRIVYIYHVEMSVMV